MLDRKQAEDYRKECEEQMNSHRANMKKAEEQLRYWEKQYEAIQTILARIVFSGESK